MEKAPPNFCVLIVDDHPIVQLAARRILEKQWPGLVVRLADDGQAALELMADNRVDLVLLDLQMPVLDGYATAEAIRLSFPRPLSDVPIVAMTAQAETEQHEAFKQSGINGLVIKPFSPAQLREAVACYFPVYP